MNLSRRLVAALAAVVLLASMAVPAAAAPLTLPAPPREGLVTSDPPTVSAESWILYDAGADLVLAAHEADEERAMASTTKIMTAYVALKYGDLDEMVTISETAADIGEAEIGVEPGERIRLETLVRALVIRSGNDAAIAVAEHIGGSVEGFADLMNEEAEALGLDDTRFVNPHGLDEPGHHSSAADLLAMSLAAMEYPEFREMAATEAAPFPVSPDGDPRVIETTNHLLTEYPGAIGVKTGFTNEARLVLSAAAERKGRTLFAVVMGSEAPGGHFEDAEALLDWGYSVFRPVEVISEAAAYVPSEPVRQVEADPDVQPEDEEEPPPPVIVTTVRSPAGTPPDLGGALGWVGRLVERMTGG